jgi:hypothetical protein
MRILKQAPAAVREGQGLGYQCVELESLTTPSAMQEIQANRIYACLHVHAPQDMDAMGPPIRGDLFSQSQTHIPLKPHQEITATIRSPPRNNSNHTEPTKK